MAAAKSWISGRPFSFKFPLSPYPPRSISLFPRGGTAMRTTFVFGLWVLTATSEPNPPSWPASVAVFNESSPDIEDKISAAFAMNGGHDPADHGQFSSGRFAFLFEPGTYTADVPVGYYM